MKQNIKRINHVAIHVKRENFERVVQTLERVLEIKFERCERPDYGVIIAVDHHDSGLEILAPTTPDGECAKVIEEHGEGHVCVIVGVKDVDAAVQRAIKEGLSPLPELGLDGTEPWAPRYKTFREIRTPIGAVNISLGQIEPK